MMLLPPTALKAVSALPSMAAMGSMATIVAPARGTTAAAAADAARAPPQPCEGNSYRDPYAGQRDARRRGQKTVGKCRLQRAGATRHPTRIDAIPSSRQFP